MERRPSVLRSIRVGTEDFDVGVEWASLRDALGRASGAIVAFSGQVRDRADRQSVDTLTLEHYPGMTERSIEAIVDQAAERWPLDAVRVIHRVGELSPPDQIVLVLVASAHRAAAFAACEFVMDYLKTDAVFWKRELSGGIGRWVESTDDDRRRQDAWACRPGNEKLGH